MSNTAAQKIGIVSGLGFTDAKARAPHLRYQKIDRFADSKALSELSEWMIRFAPLVALDGPDALMIETTGCDHLYGGEHAMLAHIGQVLNRQGVTHKMAIAGTQVAAVAAVRSQAQTLIIPEGQEKAFLADLPAANLRLAPATLLLLQRFGLHKIGQLFDIDRSSLARRFQSRAAAEAVLLKLDQALGLRHDPLKPVQPAPLQRVRLNCPEPISTSEAIAFGLNSLCQELCADLKRFGQGAQLFRLVCYRADGTRTALEIATARPVSSPPHILRLFAERLDKIDPGFGIDLMMLEAHRTGRLDASAVALSGDLAAADTDPIALSALADRICAKLGEGSVRVTQNRPEHHPEEAEVALTFRGESPTPHNLDSDLGPRPLRLLAHPERVEVLAEVPDGPPYRFVWRRVTRKVAKADGPERIAPTWWRYLAPPTTANPQAEGSRKWLTPKFDRRADAQLIESTRRTNEALQEGEIVKILPRARDYYRVEDAEGRRYWLFRSGLYGDGRGAAPEWYIHGLFA